MRWNQISKLSRSRDRDKIKIRFPVRELAYTNKSDLHLDATYPLSPFKRKYGLPAIVNPLTPRHHVWASLSYSSTIWRYFLAAFKITPSRTDSHHIVSNSGDPPTPIYIRTCSPIPLWTSRHRLRFNGLSQSPATLWDDVSHPYDGFFSRDSFHRLVAL